MLRRPFSFFLMLPMLPMLAMVATAPLAQAASEEEDETEETQESDSEVLNAHRIMTLQWKDSFKGVEGKGARLHPDDNEFLALERTTQTGGITRLLVIDKPKLNSPYYALRGEIRYQSVIGSGYLELVSAFPEGKDNLVSRTDAEYGPMRRLSGHSRLRTFWIPVNAKETGLHPDKLTLNLVMTSIGKVEIGPLELYEFADAKSMMDVATSGDKPESIRSLSAPERRLKMALTLLGITAAVGGIHFWHLKREKQNPSEA